MSVKISIEFTKDEYQSVIETMKSSISGIEICIREISHFISVNDEQEKILDNIHEQLLVHTRWLSEVIKCNLEY